MKTKLLASQRCGTDLVYKFAFTAKPSHRDEIQPFLPPPAPLNPSLTNALTKVIENADSNRLKGD